jgi:hypothetical protein
MSDSAALAAVVAAAGTKLRVLARPISEFSSCRREWVLKLGKAIAMAFMQKAAGASGKTMLAYVCSPCCCGVQRSLAQLLASCRVHLSLAQLVAVCWQHQLHTGGPCCQPCATALCCRQPAPQSPRPLAPC